MIKILIRCFNVDCKLVPCISFIISFFLSYLRDVIARISSLSSLAGDKRLVPGRRNEPVSEKTNNLGSDQVLHKSGCTVTEDGWRLEFLDLENRGIVLFV